jgi:hypothetical protein
MYATGIPLGYMCDTRGPRLNMIIGAFASGGGYYPLLRGIEQPHFAAGADFGQHIKTEPGR